MTCEGPVPYVNIEGAPYWHVIPAKAGTQQCGTVLSCPGPRFRGGDE